MGFKIDSEALAQALAMLAQAQVLKGRESWGPMALVGGRLIVDDGRIVTLDMTPVIREHNRNAARLAALAAAVMTASLLTMAQLHLRWIK